jgi:hypothetical protein
MFALVQNSQIQSYDKTIAAIMMWQKIQWNPYMETIAVTWRLHTSWSTKKDVNEERKETEIRRFWFVSVRAL